MDTATKALAAEIRNGRVVQVPRDRITERLDDTEHFLWVHAQVSGREPMESWLKDALGVCPLTYHDLAYEHLHSGLEQHGSTLAFIVTAAERGGEELDYVPVGFFLRPDRLVTVSPRQCKSVEQVFNAWLDDPDDIGMDGPSLLHGVLDAVLDDYFPALDDLHDQAEALEEGVYSTVRVDPTGPLKLKRQMLQMRKHISPIRDTLNAIIRQGAPLVPNSKNPEFNDLVNLTLRLTENIDLGRDIVSAIMDAQMSMVSNRLNEVVRTLTIISTLLMVCSLIAGIYGMNFERMPELSWAYGYPFALFLMAVAVLVVLFLFRRKKWI